MIQFILQMSNVSSTSVRADFCCWQINPQPVRTCVVTTRLFALRQQLKQQRDKLRQYQKRIQLQQQKERLLAKQLLKDGKKEWESLLFHFTKPSPIGLTVLDTFTRLTRVLSCWQKSCAAAKEETLPGPTPGQDWQSDQQLGAAGEPVEHQSTSSSTGGDPCVFSRSKTWSLHRLRRKSSLGWKLETSVWRKCTRWATIFPDDRAGRSLVCFFCYWCEWTVCPAPVSADVYWRSGAHHGWDSRRHWIPEGECRRLSTRRQVVSADGSPKCSAVCSKSTRCSPGRCRRRMRTLCWLSWRPSLRYVSASDLSNNKQLLKVQYIFVLFLIYNENCVSSQTDLQFSHKPVSMNWKHKEV